MNKIKFKVEKQRKFYKSRKTRDIDYRIKQLKKLKSIIKEREDNIIEALKKDLGKSCFESYVTEIGLVYQEIDLAIKKIRKWSKREKVKSSLLYYPSKNYIYKDPYGVVLIIGPFNYPFQLIMIPLIGAIAAGNCAIIKPSEYSVNVANIIEDIINENFHEEYLKVIDPLGGKEVVTELLNNRFDYIFFTGSVRVGKIIMEKAAKNLTPVTLELGGKSPCIVDKDCNIKMAAKRIAWGKYLNSGQTCVAPDYLYLHKDIRDEFLKSLVNEIESLYGSDINKSEDYTRIINERELDRLKLYIDEGEVYYGGKVIKEEKYISPTILVNIKDGSKILQEEIFGPILPVYDFNNIDEVLDYINNNEKPLALYYFSENSNKIEYVLNSSTSGGVTVNDTIIHASMPNLPFGGVGNSGIGSYHGKSSFDSFTHRKSVVKRGTFLEFSFRYPPYKNKINLVKKLIK